MKTDYTIKNFRIFDNAGATVNIKPITILTGCNNSGKSSIVKSICLLKDFYKQIKSDYEDGKKLRLDNYKIDFHKSPLNTLGSFKNILHNISVDDNKKNKYFTLELVVDSNILMQDVILTLEFGTFDGDDLNNGYLHSYTIKTIKGELIFTSKYNSGYKMDFSKVKKSLLYFIYTQRSLSHWQNECIYRNMTQEYPNPKNDLQAETLNNNLQSIYKDLGYRALIEIIEWQVYHGKNTINDGVSCPAYAILDDNNINDSYIDSARLGVYTFFPFMSMLKNFDKNSILENIKEKLSLSKISIIEKKIIDVFINEFALSEYNSIHDFVSNKEDSILFKGICNLNLSSQAFELPKDIYNLRENYNQILDEKDIPQNLTFEILLLSLDSLNKIYTDSNQSLLYFDDINEKHYYILENKIYDYIHKIIEDIFIHILPGDIYYTGTSVIKIKRMYSLEEDDDFSNTLKTYFESKRVFFNFIIKYNKNNNYNICDFINKWICEFDIGHHIGIYTYGDGNGATIRIFQDENDENGMLLADKGYGVIQLFTILLKIEIAIINNEYSNMRYSYYTEGLSDIIVKNIRKYKDLHPITIALEEPENHLHPSFQSKLSDLIIDAYNNYGIHFIIESHSEYLIRKLQLLISKNSINNNDISIQYINKRNKPNYKNLIENIGIDNEGNLINEFGPGFFDESIKLANKLYNSKKEN